MDNHDHTGRRDFLKQAGLGLTILATGCTTQGPWRTTRQAPLIPGIIPPTLEGRLPLQWADAQMIRQAAALHPFDLQRRMDLTVNAMTGCIDPNRGYISYALIVFQTRPPYMQHRVGDFADDLGRHTDSLWLIRSATGTRLNDEVVRRMAHNAMDIVEEGIAWNPPQDPYLWPSYENHTGRYTQGARHKCGFS